jgi:hypothetical protein
MLGMFLRPLKIKTKTLCLQQKKHYFYRELIDVEKQLDRVESLLEQNNDLSEKHNALFAKKLILSEETNQLLQKTNQSLHSLIESKLPKTDTQENSLTKESDRQFTSKYHEENEKYYHSKKLSQKE